MKRFLALYLIVSFVFLAAAASGRADDTVPVSRSRLAELERKAAEADRLAAELTTAQAELARLKNEAATKPRATAKPERWLPPVVEQAAHAAPPTPPLATLPELRKDEEVSFHDLLHHYATDPVAADARYRKRTFVIRGLVAEVDKDSFSSSYQSIFRVPGLDLRAVCEERPPSEYTKVYVNGKRDRILGESYNRSTTFVTVGTELTFTARCAGLRDGTVRFENCERVRPR